MLHAALRAAYARLSILDGKFCSARMFATKPYCRFQMMAETSQQRSSAVANGRAALMLQRGRRGF